jgi:hypothetical protein
MDGGVGGVCQPEGVCSFPDDTCPSGQRFGAHSGGLSNECVPTTPGTGETTAVSTDPASSGDGDPTLDVTGGDTQAASSSGIGPLDDTAASESTTSPATTGDEVDPSLLLWFTFDGDGGDALTNDGALGGAATCYMGTCPVLVDGPVGMAAQFDGVSNCGIYPYTDELATPEFTLALWMKRDVHEPGYDGAFTKPVGESAYNTFRVSMQGSGMPPMEIDEMNIHVGLQDNSGAELFAPMTLGVWTHFATTWSGAQLELFIDGESVGIDPTMLFEVDDHDVYVGCDDDVPIGITHFLHGSLDDVRMYARVLDPMEIAELAVPDAN